MPNFNVHLVDAAFDQRANEQAQNKYFNVHHVSQAQRRLDLLKQRIAEELLAERRLREMEQSRPKLDPLSLAPAANSNSNGDSSKKSRQLTTLDQSFHVLVQSLKLDSWVQKELEMELDRKSTEMDGLQSQNDRLREIISLRQEANQRREEALQDELDRLRNVTRRAAPPDLTSAMDELREMKELVNAGADTLYDTLKQRAVAERLALIRTFTVRIREVQNLIGLQREENTQGAQEWIDRYGMLEQEFEVTSGETNHLRGAVVTLRGELDNYEGVSAENKEKFEVLIDELASLKADNHRLQEHCVRIQRQIWESNARNIGLAQQQQHQQEENNNNNTNSRPQSGLQQQIPTSGATSPAASRPTSAAFGGRFSTSNDNNNTGTATFGEIMKNQQQQQNRPPRVPPPTSQQQPQQNNAPLPQMNQNANPHATHFVDASSEEKAQIALRRLRTTLDGMKKKIRHVRAAHIEHLQERTELELFLRQCVDDVRKDLERATSSDVHLRFSDAEKQRVVDILSAKLRVLTALHKRTFPNKLSPAMDVNFPVDVVMFGMENNNGMQRDQRSKSNSLPQHQQQQEILQMPKPTLSSRVELGIGANVNGNNTNSNNNNGIHKGRITTPLLQQQANYQLPHRHNNNNSRASLSSGGQRKRPVSSTSPPSSVVKQQDFSSSALSSPPQNNSNNNQDELMDSLWTKWQDWNAKISSKPTGKRR